MFMQKLQMIIFVCSKIISTEHFFIGNTVMETAEIIDTKKHYISIAQDFSRTPGVRLIQQGGFSGEAFRDEILFPKMLEAIQKNQKIVVDLDYTAGYASSFLEEAFGGLVRRGLSPEEILQHLEIKSDQEPFWADDILNDFIPNGLDTKSLR